MNQQPEGKDIAVIAYLTIIGLIIAFVMNNDKNYAFAKFHIRQSLGIAVSAIALCIIGIIPVLGWIISFFGMFFILFLWIMGLINAINGKEQSVPILGEKFKEWFKKYLK